jgi:hypothetical protein
MLNRMPPFSRAVLGITLAATLLSRVCGAATVFIDFESDANGTAIEAPSLFAGAVNLTTQFSPLGVVFLGPAPLDGGSILDELGNFVVRARSGDNFLGYNTFSMNSLGGVPRGPQTLSFFNSVVSLSIYVGSETGTHRIDAYSGSTLVDSETIQVRFSYGELKVSFDEGFDRVVLTSLVASSWVYDDLTFVTIPEPSTYVMAAMGVVALVLARRRK